MIRLVVLGGTGDAYLICALVAAFREHHHRDDVEVVLRTKLSAVGGLFPDVRCVIDDVLVTHAEENQAFQRSHDNQLLASDTFYAHPCFARSGVRVDQLTAKEHISQADMYRAMLRLPPAAPLTLPRVPRGKRVPNTVLMLTESTSWPNTQPTFWPVLADALRDSDRHVIFNVPSWSLAKLFETCAEAEWVIGPQCGVMSILVTGQFPCMKTLATPSTDKYVSPNENWWATRTYPYGYVTKFAGEDHAVEEFKITDDNHFDVVSAIAAGMNARRPAWKHSPEPVTTISMPLTPGDFLDRLAVLAVKRARLDREQRAGVEREYQRYVEARARLRLPRVAEDAYDDLVRLHEGTFDLLEVIVPAALKANGAISDDVRLHVKAIKLNKTRVELKRIIDQACHAPYTEVKSYHG
jgi:hypothetical protein